MTKYVAGVAGFEPTSGDSKDRCLTTWLHPIRLVVYILLIIVSLYIILYMFNEIKKTAVLCCFDNLLWSRRWDLNPQPADYKSAALPLSYVGIFVVRFF